MNTKLRRLIPGRGSSGVCILGPTSSGRMILENFRANGRDVDCFVDPQGKFRGDSWAGLPVVKLENQGELPRLKRMGIKEFVIVSGATASRRRLFKACQEAGLKPSILTHPTATVLDESRVSSGSVIGARALLGVGVTLDSNCLIGMGTILDRDVRVGPHVTIGAGSNVGADAVIEEGAFIGDGVVVLSGRKIGAGAIIVSGSVVTQDVPPQCVAAGVPARFLRRRPTKNNGTEPSTDKH